MMELIKLLIKIIIILKFSILKVNCQEFLLNTNHFDSPFDGLRKTHHLENKGTHLADKQTESQKVNGLGFRINNTIVYQDYNGNEVIGFNLEPIHYKLRIRPIFDPIDQIGRFTIPSTAEILIKCTKATNVIVLNAKLLNIDTTSVKVVPTQDATKQAIKIKSQSINEINEEYIIELTQDLQPGQFYDIYIEYVGKVFRDRLNGIYLSNYTVPNTTETKYLVVTQFEAKDARQAFPNFDQPSQKATFEISLGRREKYNSLSNMEIYKTEPIPGLDGWYWDHYNSTAKMSSYLVALVISEYTSEAASKELFHGKPVKTWAAKHLIDEQGGVFAAETVAKILQYYEKHFDIEYPLPKMDSVAIPHFDAGAMENYGLNTYRLKYLLYFPNKSDERQRLAIASVIGHELAHQWFGDLVTTRQWSQIYLNEGFASFIENLGVDSVYPEFEIWKHFSSRTLQVALAFDQTRDKSHPLVNDTLNDNGSFDTITYSKGASLIRMMKGFLSLETFTAGLQAYLKKFKFGNALQSDLYSTLHEVALQKQSPNSTYLNFNVSLNTIMDSWTLQKGYPLVRANLVSLDKIELTQEPFKFTEATSKQNNSLTTNNDESTDLLYNAQRWWIPIRMATDGKPWSPTVWIAPNQKSLLYSNPDIETNLNNWIIVNTRAYGYYRVIYDNELKSRILKQLNKDHSLIRSLTRSQLIDDYFAFGFSNYADITEALEFTLYLGEETAYNVWSTVFSNLRKTLRLFGKSEAYNLLQAYLNTRVNSALTKLGFEQRPEEKGIKVITRSYLLGIATALEDEETLKFSSTIFENWVKDPTTNKVPVNSQASIYCGSIKLKGKSAWDLIFKEYLNENDDLNRKSILLDSLSCTNDPELIKGLLAKTLDPRLGIKTVDERQRVIENVATHSPISRELLIDFLQEESQNIIQYFDRENLDFSTFCTKIISSLSFYLHSFDEISQLDNLISRFNEEIESHKTMSSFKADLFDSSIQRIRDNNIWLNQFYEPIKSWLEKQKSGKI